MKNRLAPSLLLLSICTSLFAATPEACREATSPLLDGVKTIDVGGGALPGPVVLLSDDAFPLAECDLDGTRAFATRHSAGRAAQRRTTA